MPFSSEEARLTILLGTTIILLFGVAIVALFSIFNKKSQLNQKEKEIMKAAFEKAILQSQLEIQEQTFSVISSELHDNVGQILSLSKVQINFMTESDNLNKPMLIEVKENIGKALTDLRDIAKGLNTDRIRSLSLYQAVAQELDRAAKSGIFHTDIRKDGSEFELNDQKKLVLFRIIQECIQNCIKHAEATLVEVSFTFEPSLVNVFVRDNGKGFEEGQGAQMPDGLGLMNMKKRALLAGGSVSLESRRGEGTSIHIAIPVS